MRPRVRVVIGRFLLLVSTACGTPFTPESVVAGFRVLGMRADAPELHPGDTTDLHALVLDPTRGSLPNTLLWLACDPDPLDLGRSSCSNVSLLQDPTSLVPFSDGGVPEIPPGMRVVGFDQSASYQAPIDTFSLIPPGDVRRLVGSVAQVLLLGIDAPFSPTASDAERVALFQKIKNKEIPALVALFRLTVSEETPLNQNPVLSAILVNGTALPPNATLRVGEKRSVTLGVAVPDSSFEAYTEHLPDGTTLAKTETLVAAWYTTAGRFSLDSVTLRSNATETFSAPAENTADPLPTNRSGTVWVVVRDSRGGQSWTQAPLFVCDPALPAPRATAVSPSSATANAPAVLMLAGDDLSSVLDVLVGSVALTQASYSPLAHQFEGLLPALAPGTYPVTLRGKDCQDYDTGLVLFVK